MDSHIDYIHPSTAVNGIDFIHREVYNRRCETVCAVE